MYPIELEFHRFCDVRLSDVLTRVGIYVIWDSQAKVRPSYIGKGDLLNRLANHDSNFSNPLDGYVAFLGDGSKTTHDKESLAAEALLLEVAKDTDRWPIHNKKDGHWTSIESFCRNHKLLRVSVKNCDPFAPPDHPRYLDAAKYIRCEMEADSYLYEHDWNLRKLSKRK
jgi:hypothetical protein